MCTLLCVCPPRVESLFPQVLSKSFNQIPLAFKVWFSGNSSSHCRTPRLGSLTWGSEPSLQGVNFCGISVLQSVNHPPSGYGIWFYCDCTPPPASLRLLLCLWMWGICFGEFQCLSVDDCSVVICDSSALTRGSGHMSLYSAILNPTSGHFNFNIVCRLYIHKVPNSKSTKGQWEVFQPCPCLSPWRQLNVSRFFNILKEYPV